MSSDVGSIRLDERPAGTPGVTTTLPPVPGPELAPWQPGEVPRHVRLALACGLTPAEIDSIPPRQLFEESHSNLFLEVTYITKERPRSQAEIDALLPKVDRIEDQLDAVEVEAPPELRDIVRRERDRLFAWAETVATPARSVADAPRLRCSTHLTPRRREHRARACRSGSSRDGPPSETDDPPLADPTGWAAP